MAAAERPAAALESPLPQALPAGSPTALFLFGSSDGVPRISVDSAVHAPAAARMPRPDLGGARVGWWATVPVPAHEAPGEVVIAATVGMATVELGRVPVVPRPGDAGPQGTGDGTGLIAICMATYDPDPELFAVQVASIRAQTDERWVCVIADDASPPPALARIRAAVAGDARFTVHAHDTRRGFYRNFEQALALAPPAADLIALCDQDDRWHPDKLASLRGALGDAGLAYSDMRLTDPGGRVLSDTLWAGRANNHTDLASMLVANTVTGAASLLTRRVAALALPFPDSPGLQFHDHWLALVALAAGDVAYVDRPLYDYVQHAGAVFGDVTTGRRRRRRGSARAAYFCGYVAREVLAVALIERLGADMTPAKRAVLDRYIGAQRSLSGVAWLAARRLRTLTGHSETLGGEAELVQGLLWRAAATRGLMRDASFPDPLAFEQKRLRRWRAALVGSAQ